MDTFNILSYQMLKTISQSIYLNHDTKSNGFNRLKIVLRKNWKKIIWIINHILLKLLWLAKDHWRGFNIRIAHIVHIVNWIRFKIVYTF